MTDKATGKPLAGLLVEMIPMRRHGGMPFYTRTDADGRYRVSGHQADQYITTVFPPADSGYLSVKDWHMGWPAGAKFLEKDFALDEGTDRPWPGHRRRDEAADRRRGRRLSTEARQSQ